jgi:drug/metabolite transporter (DMT)-like permease
MAILYVVWGSTYLGIAIAIESVPPFLMSAIRFAIAGALLLAWVLIRQRDDLRMPSRRELRDSLIVGGLLLGVGNGFVALGERTVPSGIAAVLIALMPLWLAVLGWVYFRDRLPRIVLAGIAIGFVGVAILVWPAGVGANAFDPFGIVVLFLAPIGWSHGSLFSQRAARLPSPPLLATALQMWAGSALLLVEAFVVGEYSQFHPESVSLRSLVAFAYLVVMGSMVAYNAYTWLLRNAPLSLIGTYAYVNPVVAVLLGAVFLSEPISARTVIAAGIILAGVAMIVTARGRLGRAPADARRSAAAAPVSPEPASPRAPSG